MKIKQYHIYSLKNNLFGDVISNVVMIQNDKANILSDYVVVPYVNKEFKGVHTIKRENLKEEIGILPDERQKELKEYYCSFIIG